ncbi:PIN domain-containing protein, partial [Breznakiellaceae bacterium SP9]
MTYVFDACALIAFLDKEIGKGYEEVDALLVRAEAGEITLVMGIVNLVEVYYGYILMFIHIFCDDPSFINMVKPHPTIAKCNNPGRTLTLIPLPAAK